LPIRRGVTCQSIELLWRCRTLAQKGRLLQTLTEVVATPATSRTIVSPATPGAATEIKGGPGSGATFTSAATNDELLMGAEITFGTTLIGHVEGLLRDPVSQRVHRLITSYGLMRRRVGVPMEWVVKRSASRLVLGVGARSLDDLCDLAPT
jgi:hypothetical protein